MMTRTDLEAQINVSLPGEAIAYYVGNLEKDRRLGEDFMQVENTAQGAWGAMMAGRVHLAQKRVGEARYVYYAIKRPKPFKKIEWCGCYDDRPIYSKPVPQLKKAA